MPSGLGQDFQFDTKTGTHGNWVSQKFDADLTYFIPNANHFQAYVNSQHNAARREEARRAGQKSMRAWLDEIKVDAPVPGSNAFTLNREDTQNMITQNLPSDPNRALYLLSNMRNKQIRGVYDPESLYTYLYVGNKKVSPHTQLPVKTGNVRRLPAQIATQLRTSDPKRRRLA
ncbi:hypothetical protein WJX72_004930 [[Myrmecia] bisecta]|uniref:Uncharacterized protein n=1 Tax=[Myrmecia] bisecta TaxID=41462 RepID=A0AAW1R655_9CHLO